MNQQDLIFLAGELFERGAPAAGIEQIADDHDEAGVGKQLGKGMNRAAQIGFARAGQLGKKIKHAEDLLAPAPQGQRLVQERRERRAADSVEIFQTDIAQRRRDLLGVVELRRVAFGHGAAGVDQQIDIHLLFGGEDFHQQAIEPPVNVPIDVAQIVAVLVAPVVGKFQAKAFARRRMLALGAGPAEPLGDQVEPFELAQEIAVEESFGF